MWKLMENIIDEDDTSKLINFLKTSDRFTNGPKVSEFENVWSKWLGVETSVMVNSGASANFLSIAVVKELFGVGEVIVPSLGWSSDISSIMQLGMIPVFVDVDPITMGMKPSSLKAAISDKTVAVVVIHALGFNALTKDIQKILDESELFVIEDCCESHGAIIDIEIGNKVGTFGNLSLFSFYFGHHITTIEGGMVCTNDQNLYQLSRMLRSHGMTREASKEIKDDYVEKYPDLNPLFTFAHAGFNFRSTELNAVLGLSQMHKLDRNIAIRSNNLFEWLQALSKGDKFRVDFNTDGNSNFALPLILQEKNNELMEKVFNKLDFLNVEYRLGTAGGGNLSRQPFLKNFEYKVIDDQSNVNHIHQFGLYVGNGQHVSVNQIIRLANELNNIF
jgi:CDP-4-dehydro-6-deoxyglucose reductase, E1